MLARLIRWFRNRYAPILPPPPGPYVPEMPTKREPSPMAASDHYPPLDGRVSRGHPDAACFAAEMLPGDKVWSFCSPEKDWRAKGGQKGVALVRDGKVVRSIVTMMS